MSDQSDPKPWTIKNVGVEERNAAIAAAKRDKVELGPWISRAIRTAIQADRQADRAPVVLEQPPVRPSDPAADLAELERMVALAKSVHDMTAKPPPRGITATVHKLIRGRLAALAGPIPTPKSRTRTAPEE